MNAKKWIILVVVLALIGGTAGSLDHLKKNQRMGRPGVKTQPLPGTENVEVILPEQPPGYVSEKRPTDKIVVDSLPKDTSFGQRAYQGTDGFSALVNVVLMGSDRTSIHKAELCLTGLGWNIDQKLTSKETVRMEKPEPYDLPVVKIVSTRNWEQDGKTYTISAVYVYWYVSENAINSDSMGLKRMGTMAWNLLRSGVLDRWAYVSYFAKCKPGDEEATFEKIKKLMTVTVPDFQLVPAAKTQVAAAPGSASR